MAFKRFDAKFGPQAKRPVVRMRVKLIAAVSITTGILTGLAAAGGIGPFEGLRPYVASHLVQAKTASSALNAGTLFPVRVGPPVARVGYAIYAPAPKQPQPAATHDDQPSTSTAQPQAGGGDNRGGDN